MSWLSEIKKIVSELSMRRKYIQDERGALEKYYQKLALSNPEKEIGRKARIAGMKTIDITWFLFCLMKYTTKYTINDLKEKNIPEKIKSKAQDFNKFFENLKTNYPLRAVRLKKWMVYTLFIGMFIGGIGVKLAKSKKYSNINTEIKDSKKIKRDKYNTKDANFVTDFVNENWDKIVICLLEFETYNEKPTLHEGEKRYTYGPGLTWVYIDGEQYPCVDEYKDMAAKFSDEQIWDQVRQHCFYKTGVLYKIKKSLIKNGFEEISAEQLLSLFLVGYQLPKTTEGIIGNLKKVGNDEQKIADAFVAGNEVSELYRAGTNKRRWWCAMLYSGNITINDLLQMDRDAFVHIKLDSIKNNNHFICNDSVVQSALQCKHQDNNSVQDFILSKNLILDSEYLISSEDNDDLDVDKVISFNQGIKNLKTKPKDNMFTYQLNDKYKA